MKSEKKVRKFSDLTDAELNDKLKDLKTSCSTCASRTPPVSSRIPCR